MSVTATSLRKLGVLPDDPLWLKEMFALLDLKETAGKAATQEILDLFAESGHPDITSDETAWCAAAEGAVLFRAGYKGTGQLTARSYERYGEDARDDPRRGDIVVKKRGDSTWQGHVFNLLVISGTRVFGIGGNQTLKGNGGAVTITSFPMDEVIAIRRPTDANRLPAAPVPRPHADRPEPSADDAPSPYSYDVRAIQQRLYDLGYTEVGEVDGEVGKMTRTAILAFRNEHDLPLTTDVDLPFLTALMAAEPRAIAPEREEAKEKELKETLPEVRATWFGKIWAYVMGIPAMLATMASGAFDALPDAKKALEPVKSVFTDVPVWGWGLLTLLLAALIWNMFNKAGKASVENYRTGARR